MKELIVAELPEPLAIGERARSLVARSSLGFALLAAIGAALVFGELTRTIASLIFEVTRPDWAPRPYDVERILGPAAGLLVARAAGATPGALAYVAYSSVALALPWLARALTCAGVFPSHPLALGLGSFCRFGPSEVLGSALPLVIGLTLGAVAARAIGVASRAGANPLLESAGAHVVPMVVLAFGARAFVHQTNGVSTQQVALILATTLLSGAIAGAVAGLRSATPLRTASLLTALLVLTWLYPLGLGQLQMAAGADRPEVYLSAVPLLDLVAIPFAAWLVARSVRSRSSSP